MAMIATGHLRNRVTITRYSQSRTETGGITSTESKAGLFANVKPMKGRRADEYKQIVNGQPYEITVRYYERDQISTGDTVAWNGLDLKIHSINTTDENYVSFIAVQRGT